MRICKGCLTAYRDATKVCPKCGDTRNNKFTERDFVDLFRAEYWTHQKTKTLPRTKFIELGRIAEDLWLNK